MDLFLKSHAFYFILFFSVFTKLEMVKDTKLKEKDEGTAKLRKEGINVWMQMKIYLLFYIIR